MKRKRGKMWDLKGRKSVAGRGHGRWAGTEGGKRGEGMRRGGRVWVLKGRTREARCGCGLQARLDEGRSSGAQSCKARPV
eukprot:1161645-Pelagomonas_calceolata.AAC.14